MEVENSREWHNLLAKLGQGKHCGAQMHGEHQIKPEGIMENVKST
jgi:hypothetical protein